MNQNFIGTVARVKDLCKYAIIYYTFKQGPKN